MTMISTWLGSLDSWLVLVIGLVAGWILHTLFINRVHAAAEWHVRAMELKVRELEHQLSRRRPG